MPEGEAHERLIRQAYGSIDLDMSDTAMIEAHGKILSNMGCCWLRAYVFSPRNWYQGWRSYRSECDR